MPERLRVVILRSNPVAPDPRVEKIARSLREFGYRVKILAWNRFDEVLPMASEAFIEIDRLAIKAEFGRGLGNFIPLIRWEWGLMRWLWRNRREYEIIHACDFDTVLPAIVAKILWKKKVIYDIFDFYAAMLRATPEWVKSIICKVDLWAIGRVDAVILVDESRKMQIKGSDPEILQVIYNSPDDHHAGDRPGHDQPRSPGALVLVFVGLLQIERGLVELIDVLAKHPEWMLILAGFGGDEEKILARAQGLPNVEIHGRVSYTEAIELMAEADVLLATYDPAIANHRFASPNKLFEAMMLAKPIVVASGTGMDEIVRSVGNGVIVEYGNLTNIEEALKRLAVDPELRRRLGRAGREAYERKYSWERQSELLRSIYEEIVR